MKELYQKSLVSLLFLKNSKLKVLYMMLYDIIAVNLSYFLGLWIRFDLTYSKIPEVYLNAFLKFSPIYTVIVILLLIGFNLYNSVWKYASFTELNRIFIVTVISTIINIVGVTVFVNPMPKSYYIIGSVLQLFFICGVRFVWRYINLLREAIAVRRSNSKRAMIIGAGAAGQIIIKDLRRTQGLQLQPCCLIDDADNKVGRILEGVPIVGNRNDIVAMAEKYKIDEIIFAISRISALQRREILEICKSTKCQLRSLPGFYRNLDERVSLKDLRAVEVEDLLGREPIKVNLDEICKYICGKTVLVTGGGGSIGSELCRQISAHKPKKLIIFDVYENSSYDIQQELRHNFPELDLNVLIGSVRDSKRIDAVFELFKPDLVFHAAAHKHVPLMETSPNEAIKNNVLGTYKTAYAAIKHGTSKFVLISTDKAVNPTNVMGASKRICEMIIQTMDRIVTMGRFDLLPVPYDAGNDNLTLIDKDKLVTRFVAVRFGNVLGSNGSVIPLFKKQIAHGGPVTVTHRDITRYFMTIPEAVSLVLQAGVYAKGGDIYVLDMGQPIKIDTLARNIIRLSGYIPDVDIDIVYTGLRPGEKLYEEKLMEEEGLKRTDNDLIHVGKPIPLDIVNFLNQLKDLERACFGSSDLLIEKVENIVPTFTHMINDKKYRKRKVI